MEMSGWGEWRRESCEQRGRSPAGPLSDDPQAREVELLRGRCRGGAQTLGERRPAWGSETV